MTMKNTVIVIMVVLPLVGIAVYPINANTDHRKNTHSVTSDVPHDRQHEAHATSTTPEDFSVSDDNIVVSSSKEITENHQNNLKDKKVTKDLQTVANTFGVEVTTDYDATTYPVPEDSLFFPIANSYEGSYYLLSRARRIVDGDPTLAATVSSHTLFTKAALSETAIYARRRRVGQWIGGCDLFTELDFFDQQDKRYNNWAAEMDKKEKYFKEVQMRRQRDEIEIDVGSGDSSKSSSSLEVLHSLTLSTTDTTKQAKLRRTFLSNNKHTIEAKILRLADDTQSFYERIYYTFMNDHIPKETEVGQKLRNNNIGAGKTRKHVRELRDTFYKYYSDDPSVISLYIDDVNIASAVASNEDYTDSDTPLETPNEPYLFGMLSLTKYGKSMNGTAKSLAPSYYRSSIFNRTTSWFQFPSSLYPSILSVPFFDFSEMNLLWHEYHSLKKDEKWLLENCLASMSKCRTDDMALRSNMRGKNDPNKSSTQKKNNKDSRTESDYDTSEERSTTGTNDATSEIEGHEAAHLLGSSESYYHDLQNNILVPRVTHPLQQLLKTFTYSHSYQRKLMYSGLPLLLYQVQPHLNSEVQILRSQMSANDESTMEKRRELKQQNQLLKAVSRKQKEVQLLVDHIQQCIQYKKQSSMNMNYIPSLLRWVSIVRRYGGVDPFPSVRDIEVPLTDAQKRRQRHKEARARNADGLPSLTKPDSNPSSDNDNDDNQRTPLAGVTSYSIKLFNRGSVSDAFHWVIFTTFGLRIYEAIVIIMIMVLPTCIDIAINTPYCAVQIYRFVSRFCVPWLMKIQKNPNHRSATRSASNPQPSHSNVQCGADIKGDNNNNSWFLTFTISAMHFVLSTVGVIVTLYAQFGFLIVPLVPLVFFLGLFERNFIEPLFDLVTGKGRGMFSNYITSSYRRVDESTIEIWFTVWAVVTRVQKISIFVVLTFLWAFLAYFVLRPMYRLSLIKEGASVRGRRLGSGVGIEK